MVLNLLTYQQMNKKRIFKIKKKTFGKIHTNYRTLFSTKQNIFAQSCDKYRN